MNSKSNKDRLFDAIAGYPALEKSPIKLDYYATENFCLGCFKSSPDNQLPVCYHSHDEYEFIIPLTPVHYMLREEQICFGQVGCVYPIESGVGHGIKYSQPDVRILAISINKDFLEEIKKEKHCEHVRFEYELPYTPALRCFLNTFKVECRKPARDEKNKLEPLTRLITAEFIDLASTAKQVKLRSSSLYQQGVRSAADYINEHYAEELTLEELSAICGLSPGYFTRCFTKMFLNSPTAYIAMVRISHAKKLLEDTLLPVKDIAIKVGYHRSSTFCDAFKKETGMSPNEYRAQVLGFKEGYQRK